MTSSWQGWGICMSFFALMFCFLVIICYWRFPYTRKAPAPMLLYKTWCDFFFCLLSLIMIASNDIGPANDNDPYTITPCSFFGSVTVLCFLAAQGYFTGICLDLRLTILNPFRRPASDTIKIHFLIWVICVPLTIFFLGLGAFHYRADYDVCFICDTGNHMNVYYILLIMIPLIVSNLVGVITLFQASYRLNQGLPSTIKSRQTVVIRQRILIIWFSIAFGFAFVFYGIGYLLERDSNAHKEFDEEDGVLSSNLCLIYDKPSKSSAFPVFFLGLVFVSAFADAGAFISLNLGCVNDSIDKRVTNERSRATTNITMNKSINSRVSLINRSANNKSGGGGNIDGSNASDHYINMNALPNMTVLTGLNSSNSIRGFSVLSMNTEEGFDVTPGHGHDHDHDSKKGVYGGDQLVQDNLSDALRFECVSYMTAGIAQSVKNTAIETWKMSGAMSPFNTGRTRVSESTDAFQFGARNTFNLLSAGASSNERVSDERESIIDPYAIADKFQDRSLDNELNTILNGIEQSPPVALYPTKAC